MGLFAAKNAVLVAARLGLGNTATRLLLHMALECWDDADNPGEQPPRRYFGGRESSRISSTLTPLPKNRSSRGNCRGGIGRWFS